MAANSSFGLASAATKAPDGSYLRPTSTRPRTPGGVAQTDGATPYNSHPDLWRLTLGERLPCTSPGLKRQRHAKLCGLRAPGVSAKAHHEFTERDVWPEYTPDCTAPPARRWTGIGPDGYVESAETRDVRDQGWQMGLQRATMVRTADTGIVRRHGGSGARWFRRERFNEATGVTDTWHCSHIAPSRHQRAPEPEPYSPAEMRAVGIAASRSWDELPRDRGLLAPYSWRGATALRAQKAAGRIEWHAR